MKNRCGVLMMLLVGLAAALFTAACSNDGSTTDAGVPVDAGSHSSSEGGILFLDGASDAPTDGGCLTLESFYACGLYINAWCDRWVKCCADSETCVRDASNANISSCVDYQASHGFFDCKSDQYVHGHDTCWSQAYVCTDSVKALTCDQISQGAAGRTPVCTEWFQQFAGKQDGQAP